MNEFDRRWQVCANQARQVDGRSEVAPFGFAARVVARGKTEGGLSWADLWLRLGVRALAGVTTVLALVSLLEWREVDTHKLVVPHMENYVAQVFWIL